MRNKPIKETSVVRPVKRARYAEALPEAQLSALFSSLEDNEQASLSQEIALTDSFLIEATKALSSGEVFGDGERKELISAVHLLDRGIASRDNARISEAVRRLRNLALASADRRGWSREIRGWVEMRRRLVESQSRREKDAGEFVPLVRVNLMLGYIFALVQQHVSVKEDRQKLVNDLSLLLGRSTALPALPTA